MKDIRELTSIQVRIFPADYIPYSYLLRKEFVDYIVNKYNFTSNEMPFENLPGDAPKIIVFRSGEYKIEKKKIIIKQLTFENRRIVTESLSTSKEANKLFSLIARDIKKFQIEGQFRLSDVDYFGEETSCVVSLNVDCMSIFSPKMGAFLNDDLLNKLKHEAFEIYPKSVRFEISFKPEEKLMKKRITLSPKRLILEPRTEHSLDQKVFFTKSPSDTDTHLNMLHLFEKRMN
ncbi:MAG: hypothetical protein HF981_10875 [Desulfobacteraceae bacterium]|nr:hypothetical protein [Desulfobacteraceae bacterium]MBC2750877.1 hypothetical protein [Desulfobacteraceae bacterium]